jgi:hypothetical protein
MVLTRKQTKELQERELSTMTSLTSQCNPLDSLNNDPVTAENVVDTLTGGSPRRSVLQTHNTLTPNTITCKGMQGSARKGLTSWPLGKRVGGVIEETEQRAEQPTTSCVVSQRDAAEDDVRGKQETERGRGTAEPSSPSVPPAMVLPTGPEPADPSQVDLYPSRASFVPYSAEQLPSTTSSIVENIGATSWLAQVNAMNELRRLAVHHGADCDSLLTEHSSTVFPAIVKAIKSPRSNVSKSAIMTVRDLFEMVPGPMGTELGKDAGLTDMSGLLMVLLTKAASNDKKFVVDEALGALDCMCDCVEASIVLRPALSGATEHKNPRVRGRCFVLLRSVVSNAPDLDTLLLSCEGALSSIVVACHLGTTDNTPEARECARDVMCVVFKDGRSDRTRAWMEEALGARNGEQGALGGDVDGDVDVDVDGDGHGRGEHTPASLLERYTTLVLGNRGKSLILLGKCGLGV